MEYPVNTAPFHSSSTISHPATFVSFARPCDFSTIQNADRGLPQRNPIAIANAYTPDSIWRNRSVFIRGRNEIIDFLAAKWARETNYRLRKELFAHHENRIAVQFWYEYRDSYRGMHWKRTYGIEHWTFAEDGRMEKRIMSGNEVLIGDNEVGGPRWFPDDVEEVDAVDIEKEMEWEGNSLERFKNLKPYIRITTSQGMVV